MLLVDDDERWAAALKANVLRVADESLTISPATTLAKAIEALRGSAFDLVLLDLNLPDAYGVSGVRRLKSEVPTTPIIVITANDDLAMQAIRAGAEEYLVKTEIRPHSVARAIRYAVERRRASEKFARLERVSGLGVVAASVAHEFNNVLMGIQPFVELLDRSERADRDRDFTNAIAHIRGAIQRGRRVSEEILRFVRPAIPHWQPIDVRVLLEAAIDEERPHLEGVVLRLDAPDEPLYVAGDRHQLMQAVLNVVTNAREAMTGGGTITVSAGPVDPARLHIVIADTGPGMSPAVTERIFEPFFTTKHVGTGLGLPVVQQIVAQHNGEILVDSQLGLGTTFTLVLPLTAPPDASPAERQVLGELRGRKILLVDDDATIVAGLTGLLELEGAAVQAVQRGHLALDAVRRFQPDAVVLDMRLPDVSGLDVYEKLIAYDSTLPVIFSTGEAETGALEGTRLPATAFLRKPYDFDALRAVLLQLLAERE